MDTIHEGVSGCMQKSSSRAEFEKFIAAMQISFLLDVRSRMSYK